MKYAFAALLVMLACGSATARGFTRSEVQQALAPATGPETARQTALRKCYADALKGDALTQCMLEADTK